MTAEQELRTIEEHLDDFVRAAFDALSTPTADDDAMIETEVCVRLRMVAVKLGCSTVNRNWRRFEKDVAKGLVEEDV